MSALKLAVLRQIAYSHSVRGFIRDILKALIPGKWIDRVIDSSGAASLPLRRRDFALLELESK